MPITVGKDAQGALIWVDSKTGEPAVHLNNDPSGPFVAPSDLRAVQDEHAPTTDISAADQAASPSVAGGTTVASAPPRHGVNASIQAAVNALDAGGQKWHLVGDGTPIEDIQPKTVTDPTDPGNPKVMNVGTGDYYVLVRGDNGDERQMTLKATPPNGQVLKQTGNPQANEFNGDLNELVWTQKDPLKDVATAKPPAQIQANTEEAVALAAKAKSDSDAANVNLAKLTNDQKERDANQAAGKGYVTDDELRKINQDAAAQKLSQDTLNQRIQEASDKNHNDEVSNQISLLNAQTSARNADISKQEADDRVKIANNQLDLDQAKLDHQIRVDNAAQANAQDKLKLDQLTQQQTNQVNVRRVTQEEATGKETARHDVAQEQQAQQDLQQRQQQALLQAQTSLQTAGIQAAANAGQTLIDRSAKNAATGAGLEQQRAQTVANMLNSTLGLAGRLGSVAPPAGTGALIAQGIQGMATEALGGQSVMDSAARMIQQADPQSNLYDPTTQSAVATLAQMLDKYHDLTNMPHPSEANVNSANAAGAQSNANNGMAAPAPPPPAPPPPPPATPVAAPGQSALSASTLPGSAIGMMHPGASSLAAPQSFTAPPLPQAAALANFPMGNFQAPPM